MVISKRLLLLSIPLMLWGYSGFSQSYIQEFFYESIVELDYESVDEILDSHPYLIDSSMYRSGFLGGRTVYPIHLAIMESDQKMILHLLDKGAVPERYMKISGILTVNYKSSLELLVEYRELEDLKALIYDLNPDFKAYTDALRWSAGNSEVDKTRYLLEQGEEILLNRTTDQ